MNSKSTPLRPASKKRELSSPEELLELKKNKLSSLKDNKQSESFVEQSDSVTSDLSIMADEKAINNAGVQRATSGTTSTITLQETDLITIADILRQTFEPQMSYMAKSIVDGVIAGLNSTIQALQKENKSLRDRVEMLEARADASEQYSRRNCLRIAGVPEDANENTDVYIIDLARAIEADVSLDDIERSHRVGKQIASSSRPRDIIVKFLSYRTRRKFYGARTKTKKSGYTGVFINEDLTKPRRKLLLKARQMVKFRHLNSAWSSDGNILVRDSSGTKHRITREADLAVFGPVPQLQGEKTAAGGTDSETTALHTPLY